MSAVRTAQRGFTLIELMVVVSVIAILLSVAIPNLSSFKRNSELRATASSFMAALQSARAESMKRGVDVYMVPASDDQDWSKGWIVYADNDRSQTKTTPDTVVLQTGPIAAKTTVASSATDASQFAGTAGKFIRFNGGGFPVAVDGSFRGGAIEFNVAGSTERRRVVLNRVGRARLCDPVKDTTADCRQPS